MPTFFEHFRYCLVGDAHPTQLITQIMTFQNSHHLPHPKYRPDIDGLRAVAVLSVVIFHAFPNLLKGGFIGVDIFFVISGFLISTIILSGLEKDSFSFAEFYSRRIKRIYPALLLVLIASFIFGWFTLLADEYKQLGKHIAGGAGFVSNFVLWTESGYFDNTAETKPLLHLWSLGIEEQFYIVWPLLLWFVWKQRLNQLTIALVILSISFFLNINSVETDATATFYSPQTRFWELLIGSILAYVTLRQPASRQKVKQKFDDFLDTYIGPIVYAQTPKINGGTRRNLQSLLGASFIIISIIIINKQKFFPGWWALLPTIGTVLIISAGMQAWFNRAILSNRLFVWFGLISFPLYLWHWPLLSFSRIIEGGKPTQGIRFAAILISIVLAWLTYKFIEKPIRFGNHSKEKTTLLLVIMILVGGAGYYDYKQDGLTFRFPEIVQSFTQQYTRDKEWDGTFCFLDTTQDYTFFDSPALKNACQIQPENNKPTLFLWGDSVAAHSYPGYKTSFGDKFRIITRTSAGCPPILNTDSVNGENNERPFCRKNNDYIFELIKKEKPNKVVLQSVWYVHDWKQLADTVHQLQHIGITDIDVIGLVPVWEDNLPKLLYKQFKMDTLHRIPERMNSGLRRDIMQIDVVMEKFIKELNVNYISPIKILCNEQGCITTISDKSMAYDTSHLTSKGSQFLVSKFPKN
ncbi:MAG: acyltransferase family protein [Methylococcales bacterium]|nr:acyltransferase family protein [Methylococcales bacterium]MDP3838942.1 acyltransferase family protein [Methylococcales bacterium]